MATRPASPMPTPRRSPAGSTANMSSATSREVRPLSFAAGRRRTHQRHPARGDPAAAAARGSRRLAGIAGDRWSSMTSAARSGHVTASRMSASQEELGDLKLYRIPEPVTVAAHSQKQVAFLERAGVPVAMRLPAPRLDPGDRRRRRSRAAVSRHPQPHRRGRSACRCPPAGSSSSRRTAAGRS